MPGGAAVALRLATCNVRHLTRGTGAAAGVLRSLGADVVCVQDAPRVVRWRSRSAALARRAGLVYVTGSGTVLLASHRTFVTFREDLPLPGAPSAAIAVFRFAGGRRLAVASLRPDRRPDRRQRHVDLTVRRLESLSRRFDAPYVLGEQERIVAGPDVEVVSRGATAPGGGVAVGDHRPVVAELELP